MGNTPHSPTCRPSGGQGGNDENDTTMYYGTSTQQVDGVLTYVEADYEHDQQSQSHITTMMIKGRSRQHYYPRKKHVHHHPFDPYQKKKN